MPAYACGVYSALQLPHPARRCVLRHPAHHIADSVRAPRLRTAAYLTNASSGGGSLQKITVFGEPTLERGFLPKQDPLQRLPGSEFDAWEEALQELPKRVAVSGYTSLQRWLESLPPFPIEQLLTARGGAAPGDAESAQPSDSPELWRAMLVLSFLSQAYVWGEPGVAQQRLPARLALPWARVAGELGVPPIMSHAVYNLYNWRRLDATRPPALGNAVCLANFNGGMDEEWFRLIHIDIEAAAAPGVASVRAGQAAAAAGDARGVSACLSAMQGSMEHMGRTIAVMGDKCDPHVYFHRVRPWMSGWRNNPQLPNGLLYKGVSPQPLQLYGATGAQSCAVPTFDAALGVSHSAGAAAASGTAHAGGAAHAGSTAPQGGSAGGGGGSAGSTSSSGGGDGSGGSQGGRAAWLSQYLQEMQAYMPPAHRAFIDAVRAGPSMREFVLASGDPCLRQQYNECVAALERFRGAHSGFAHSHIVKFSERARGTGGSDVMPALQGLRTATRRHLIQ